MKLDKQNRKINYAAVMFEGKRVPLICDCYEPYFQLTDKVPQNIGFIIFDNIQAAEDHGWDHYEVDGKIYCVCPDCNKKTTSRQKGV